MPQQTNFGFLDEHDPIFAEIGAAAERAFAGDPNTTLIKLRQLGEALAQDLAARSGILVDETTSRSASWAQHSNQAPLSRRRIPVDTCVTCTPRLSDSRPASVMPTSSWRATNA